MDGEGKGWLPGVLDDDAGIADACCDFILLLCYELKVKEIQRREYNLYGLARTSDPIK